MPASPFFAPNPLSIKHLRNRYWRFTGGWAIERLRFLLYPTGLTAAHEEEIRKDDAGVVWLGKK